MSVKITIPNTSSDYLTFGSANTPDAAKIGGYDDGSSAGHLEFYTTTSGTSTERMRIDASGNVGIGTSSPSTYGKLAVSGVLGISNVGASGYAWRYFRNNTTPTAYCYDDGTNVSLTVQTAGALQFGTNDTERMRIDSSGNVGIGTNAPSVKLNVSDGTVGMQMNPSGGVGYYGTITNHPAVISTNGSERMRIDSSGNVLVGTTDASENAGPGIKAINSTTDAVVRVVANSATAGNSGYVLYNTNATNNGYRFFVKYNGGISNYSANNTNLSDERLKTDITPAKSYLDTICSIPVVTFKYKDQTDDELNLGVIAQSVDAVAPELVDHNGFGEAPEGENPYLAVYQTDLQYALMKCIQELKAELDTVKSELATLKGTV